MDVYEVHPDCKVPDDEQTIIWRYMDLPKFVSLLQRKALFFTSIQQLKLGDPYEGSLSTPTRNFPIEPTVDEETSFAETGYKRPAQLSLSQMHKEYFQPITKRYVVANCWHINEFESAAMWQLYASYNQGIAIQSSLKRLRDAFIITNKSPRSIEGEIIRLSLGEVQYIDYRRDRNNFGNVMTIGLYKRKSFEHERELRAITLLPWSDKTNNVRLNRTVAADFKNYGGVYFPVDLPNLINQVYIAPNATHWFKEIVTSIVKKHGLKIPVSQSDLLTDVT